MPHRSGTTTFPTLRDRVEAGDVHAPMLSAVEYLGGIVDGVREPVVFRHPLDFFCVPTFRSDDFGFCVHAWGLPGVWGSGRSQLTTSPFHLHSWDLLSTVLLGSIANELVEVVPDDVAPEYRIFEIFKRDGKQDVDDLIPTPETVSVRRCPPRIHLAGTQYGMPAYQYHCADEGRKGEPTVTVALATGWDERPQRSLGPLTLGAHTVEREQLSGDDARALAGGLLDLLVR